MTLRERAGSYEGRLILGVIGLFVVVPVLGLALGLRVGRGFDGYTAGIYVGTGMAVLWYTIETYYLRRAMVRANEIAVLPLVIARFEQVPVPGVAVGGTWAWKVVLPNIGKSAALRVEVEEFNVEDTALGKEVWRIEGIDVIEGGKSVAVESSAYLANRVAESKKWIGLEEAPFRSAISCALARGPRGKSRSGFGRYLAGVIVN